MGRENEIVVKTNGRDIGISLGFSELVFEFAVGNLVGIFGKQIYA